MSMFQTTKLFGSFVHHRRPSSWRFATLRTHASTSSTSPRQSTTMMMMMMKTQGAGEWRRRKRGNSGRERAKRRCVTAAEFALAAAFVFVLLSCSTILLLSPPVVAVGAQAVTAMEDGSTNLRGRELWNALKGPETRIIGGDEVATGRYDYFALMRGRFLCGAVLIGPRLVLGEFAYDCTGVEWGGKIGGFLLRHLKNSQICLTGSLPSPQRRGSLRRSLEQFPHRRPGEYIGR